ncbi:MAG: 50S ribosomal protein L11 methyltransferase [Sandaracinaceae bacterium]|nr:50S ribosomal protein L11 methyltransferase [Sandaracinaceae bacterium]
MTETYGFDDPGGQAVMVLDHPRTSAYAEAIWQGVNEDDVVLDVGSGSGVLALLAAQAGAKRVYAVERSSMATVLRENVKANGLEGRVEVIERSLEDIEPGSLAEPATVILSETLGHFAPDEHGHRLYQMAKRLAVARPRLIPGSYRVRLTIAHLRSLTDELARLEDCHGIRLSALADRLRSRPVMLDVPVEDLLATEAATGPHTFLEPRPEIYEATCEATADGVANAIVASFDVELVPGVTLSTGPTAEPTHWHQIAFPMFPELPVRAGEPVRLRIRPRLVTDRGTWLWSAESGGQVRGGDAMKALTATTMTELAQQLGLRLAGPPALVANRRLRAFAAILAGGADASDVDGLSHKLMRAMPEDFPHLVDARDEVLALLRAADCRLE